MSVTNLITILTGIQVSRDECSKRPKIANIPMVHAQFIISRYVPIDLYLLVTCGVHAHPIEVIHEYANVCRSL